MCMWQEGPNHVCACGRKELAMCVHVKNQELVELHEKLEEQRTMWQK